MDVDHQRSARRGKRRRGEKKEHATRASPTYSGPNTLETKRRDEGKVKKSARRSKKAAAKKKKKGNGPFCNVHRLEPSGDWLS